MGGRCDGGAVPRRTQGVGAMAGAIAKRRRGTPAAPRLRRPPLARRAVLARGQRAPRGARSARSADFGKAFNTDEGGHQGTKARRTAVSFSWCLRAFVATFVRGERLPKSALRADNASILCGLCGERCSEICAPRRSCPPVTAHWLLITAPRPRPVPKKRPPIYRGYF
jgi:hypothetical protein